MIAKKEENINQTYSSQHAIGVPTKIRQQRNQNTSLKHLEIIIQGRWLFTILPFVPREYFICHESRTTTLGLRLKRPKTRKEIRKFIIEFQERANEENHRDSP